MTDLIWFHPRSLDEALTLLQDESLRVHGGGTHILRSGRTTRGGLLDISQLGLDFVRIEKEWIDIGAMATYSDVIRALRNSFPDNVLTKALSQSASTPLRNRITVGGSLALLPPWSSILGPAVASDAMIFLEGGSRGGFPLSEFRENKPLLLKGSLIHSMRIPLRQEFFSFHPEKRVASDYPSFTVTALAALDNGVFSGVRIVVTGVKSLFVRLETVERGIDGHSPEEVDVRKICTSLPLSFADKPAGSSGFLCDIASVRLERCLSELISLASGKRG